MNNVFSEDEQEIWQNIGMLFAAFNRLEHTHPSDMPEVVNAVHTLQDVLGRRLLRRGYPDLFAAYKLVNGKWELSK